MKPSLRLAIAAALAALLAAPAIADSYVLLGAGVCRKAGEATGEVYSYKNWSWERCREACSSRSCSGVEYNLRGDRSTCEHHYYPVKLKKAEVNGAVLSCWARQN